MAECIKGTYNSTPPTVASGEDSNIQIDTVGNLKATIATKVSTPTDAPVQAYPAPSTMTRITTATTTVVSATGTRGWYRLKVQNGTMGATTVYDNGAASGTVHFTGTPAAKDIIFGEWTRFETGLCIVTAAATELFVETIVL